MRLVGEDIGVAIADSERVLSCDVTRAGAWVVAVDDGRRTTVRFSSGTEVVLRQNLGSLIVASAGVDQALVVMPRTTSTKPNAWLVAPGWTGRRFFVGDAVADVVRLGGGLIAVTYFDEGFGGPISSEGVAVFDLGGTLRRGYRSSSGEPVMDCYAAVAVGPQTVGFWPYDRWRLTEWNVESGSECTHVVPGTVRGAGAVTQHGDRWWFFSPHSHAHAMYEWRVGSSKVTEVGLAGGPLRGLAGGRFVDLSDSRPTVITMPSTV